MGIHSLTKLIQQKSPDSIEHHNLFALKGKRIAIDTSIFLYKSLINVRHNGDYLKNKEGKIMSHIYGLFNKIVLLKSYGIEPIFIFDGKPPPEKKTTLDNRNKRVIENREKLKNTNDVNEKKKLEKYTVRICSEYIRDLENLFEKMGVSYIHASGEAEAYAAELCRINYVYAVMSEDMDTLVYDCPRLIRSCILKENKSKNMVSIFNLDKIKEDFNMDIKQFTDMCILCGCDYCPTIPKVGPTRAYNNIKSYKTIENILESDKFVVSDEFKGKYKLARNLFTLNKNKIDIDNMPINNYEYIQENLETYLLDICNMNKTRVNNSLIKLKPLPINL